MICTYCGRAHTAASCQTRPRLSVAATAIGVLMAGCSDAPPVPSSLLKEPPAYLMEDPKALPPIPADDGDIRVRTKYNTKTRVMYGELAANYRGLQRWVRAGKGK